LKSNRRFSEASQVFLDYAEDVEEAVVALLEGSKWAESLRVIHLHERRDLVETHLLPALVEAHNSSLSLFQDLGSKFTQYSSRLVVVRENKKLKRAAILGMCS
jgi:elongator complex protein 1